jgi:hypothetical protein
MNINLRQAPKEAPASTEAVISVGVWLVLATYVFIVKIILDIFLPQAFADPAQAAQFSWINLGL